ncbi:MAG: hypothetical protein KKF44_10690 [Nanoarchaeota archaeon]|nr:hypothetical protein [Nanoarchaeota archaeon]
MTVIGFNFTKMLVEKKNQTSDKIDIANNVVIKEIKEAKLNMGSSKKPGLEFTFEFTSKYNPNIALIELTGKIVYMDNEDKVKSVLDLWSKSKKIDKSLLGPIYNAILARCNVEAIVLSRDMQLPPPIPMPKVKKD